MKQEQHRDFEEMYHALEKLTEEYPEFFKALEFLSPTDPPVFIENGTTTTPYGEPERAKLE